MAQEKSSFAIVTDSTSDISLDYAEEMNITIVPAWVRINEKEYKDQIDLSKDEFFELAKKVDGKVPRLSTSTPSAGEFNEVFEELAKNHQEILAIHLGSKLSALFQTSVLGASYVEDRRIVHFDSSSVSWGIALLVKVATEMRDEGKTLDETVEILTKIKDRVRVYAVFKDLSYAKAGGRISSLKYYAGRFLQLKPIISVEDGEVISAGFTRSMKGGREKMVEKLIKGISSEEKVWVAVGHSGDLESIEWLKETLAEKLTIDFVYEFFLGSVLGAHIGPEAIGAFLIPDWKLDF